jgi:hypothetical protein
LNGANFPNMHSPGADVMISILAIF